MGGGLLQLVAYGAQDVYLTGNPQITFFKVVYRRHTNFAMEAIQQTFNGNIGYGNTITCQISRNGDLINRMYLQVDVPKKTSTAAIDSYVNYLGLRLIKSVVVEIGGQQIDKHYSDWLYIWNELSLPMGKRYAYDTMVGADKDITTNKSTTLYIPFEFWFCRNVGLALPLIALQYHEVKINVIWKEPLEIAGNYNNVSKLPQASSAALYIDYIYLDTEERRRFAQQSHEYLIEQVQFNEDVGISSPNQRIDLTFNHPVKELIWVVQPRSYTDCKAAKKETRTSITTRLLPYVYDKPAVYEQWIQMNGQDRLERRYGDYFNKVQPYQHHTGFVPGVGVYMYSFAIKPEENQPSGTCNFSRVDTATIVMTMDGSVAVNQDTDDTWNVRVYAINYNVLRIMSGMGGLAYSN